MNDAAVGNPGSSAFLERCKELTPCRGRVPARRDIVAGQREIQLKRYDLQQSPSMITIGPRTSVTNAPPVDAIGQRAATFSTATNMPQADRDYSNFVPAPASTLGKGSCDEHPECLHAAEQTSTPTRLGIIQQRHKQPSSTHHELDLAVGAPKVWPRWLTPTTANFPTIAADNQQCAGVTTGSATGPAGSVHGIFRSNGFVTRPGHSQPHPRSK